MDGEDEVDGNSPRCWITEKPQRSFHPACLVRAGIVQRVVCLALVGQHHSFATDCESRHLRLGDVAHAVPRAARRFSVEQSSPDLRDVIRPWEGTALISMWHGGLWAHRSGGQF